MDQGKAGKWQLLEKASEIAFFDHSSGTWREPASERHQIPSPSRVGNGAPPPPNGLLMTQINDHAAFDFALLHFVENLIDIFDRTQRYLRHHLALRGKLEGFGEVLSSADQ